VKTIALVLFVAACGEAHSSPPAPSPQAVPVGVVTAARRDIPLYLEAIGSLDGYNNVEIRARVRGYLTSQSYKDGARVRAGDVLFRIEPAEFNASGEAAEANLARARVALDRAKLEAQRDRGLRQAGMISQQDLDNADAAVRDAEAQLRGNAADVARASLDLRYTIARSPIDGVAGLAQVRVGNLVGQDGPTLLATVSQLDPMRVNFPVPEAEYVEHPEWFADLDGRDLAWATHQFANGSASLELALANGSAYAQHAVIVAIDRRIDAANGTVQVQALVPNPDGRLRPGEFTRVRIPRVGEGKGVVVVPERALVSVQGSFSIAVVGADHRVAIKRVQLGPAVDGVRVVESGLAGGELIVVDGLQRISDGATVDPHPAQPETRN
jgi:membrane fusion protein (multidrug efflux system)